MEKRVIFFALAFVLTVIGFLSRSNEYDIRTGFARILFFIVAAVCLLAALFT